MEKRQQGKDDSTTKRKAGKPAHVQQERQEELDLREELKQRSNKAVNVASLEERLGSKSTAKYSPRQQDFRHLLRRQPDHSRIDSNTAAAGGTRAATVDHQRYQQQYQKQQHGAGVHLSPMHQDRGRTHDNGGIIPEFRGGRGDKFPRSNDGVQNSSTNTSHGSRAREGRSTSHHHHHYQVSHHRNIHYQDSEDRDLNYDFETQF